MLALCMRCQSKITSEYETPGIVRISLAIAFWFFLAKDHGGRLTNTVITVLSPDTTHFVTVEASGNLDATSFRSISPAAGTDRKILAGFPAAVPPPHPVNVSTQSSNAILMLVQRLAAAPRLAYLKKSSGPGVPSASVTSTSNVPTFPVAVKIDESFLSP